MQELARIRPGFYSETSMTLRRVAQSENVLVISNVDRSQSFEVRATIEFRVSQDLFKVLMRKSYWSFYTNIKHI